MDDASENAHRRETLRDDAGRVRQGWRTAFASLGGLSVGPSPLTVMAFGVFAPYLDQEFGWGIGATAFGATILSLMIMLLSPVQGLLIDRFGARPLILTSIPLFGFGYAAMALLSGPLWQFYLAWILLPLLGIGLWPGSYLKATSSWFDRRLGLAIAVATVGIGIGGALFPILIGTISEGQGWRTAYAAVGLLSVAIAWPLAAIFIKDNPVIARSNAPGMAGAASGGWPELRTADFWLLVAGFLLMGFVSSAMLVHQVSILIDNGMARGSAVAIQSIVGLATIAGRIGAGWMLDRLSVRIVMPLFAGAAAIAIGLFALGATGGMAVICAMFVGLLIGAEIDVLGYVVKRYFGTRRYGTLYGFLFSAFQLGGALGVAALGMIRDSAGSYVPGLLALVVACGVATVVFAILGPYRDGSARPGLAGAPSPEAAANA